VAAVQAMLGVEPLQLSQIRKILPWLDRYLGPVGAIAARP
jgi:hypothetical protein